MLSFSQGVFKCTKIARITFGLQSYSFVENYVNSLNQGVFDCTTIAQLPFG